MSGRNPFNERTGEHTPEPWRYDGIQAVVSGDKNDPLRPWETLEHREWYGGALVCESVSAADALRIIACVNFCAGLPTETIEKLIASGIGAERLAAPALASDVVLGGGSKQ